MEFVLNGRVISLDATQVATRLAGATRISIQTHWVDIDGHRWPPKQALRLALGGTEEAFISHFALRVFRRLGFSTSALPKEVRVPAASDRAVGASDTEDAAQAFRRLDSFMSAVSLRHSLSALESSLDGAGRDEARRVVDASGYDLDLVESAMVIRERVGKLDTLIHSAVISLAPTRRLGSLARLRLPEGGRAWRPRSGLQ